MRKSKNTKRSLLMSVLSLLVCISMLIGSTFAWFTDSVTSGRNVIAAGNLDIELLVDGTTKVDAGTVLFDNSLWEPGVVVYENLQVANVGSLALKYQMVLNVIGENTLDGHGLSEVVKVAVIDAVAAGASRAEVLAAAKASGNVCDLADFYVEGELLAKTNADAQAIVIFWEPNSADIDNLYNVNNGKSTSDGQPLYIEFGIELTATQLMHEEDSFDNMYDIIAPLEKDANGLYSDEDGVYYVFDAASLSDFAAYVNSFSNYERPFEGETVKLLADVDMNGAEWTPIGDYRFSANRFCGIFDGQGHTISNFKITKKTDKNDSNKSSYGFFGNVEGTVKNLTVADATVTSYAYCGALIGRLNSGLVENCHVINSTVAPSYWQGGIMIGQVNGGTVKACTVTGSTITGKSALGGMFGPVSTENGDILFENCTVKDSAVNQSGSFGGNYDKYFGGMFGYVESDANRVDINNCSVTNTTVKGEASSLLSGDNDGNVYFNGVKAVTAAAELANALKAGGNVVLGADIALESTAISNANFVLDGNGYTITQNGTNSIALLDISGGTATIKNVTFDGISGGALVRTVDVKFNATNVIAKNGNHTQQQGMFRLLGESTVENCTFVNNTCNMVITLNYDGDYAAPQAVTGCVFEGNTCNDTAVVYYVDGTGFTADGNKFVNNAVSSAGNGATMYVGFMENAVITNNLFQGNNVTSSHLTSKRVAGALMIGYEAEISGNAFIDNTVTAANAKGNDVCASVYHTDIDLSGNYWGGSAPVENDDYFVEYPDNHQVIVNGYLTVNPFN